MKVLFVAYGGGHIEMCLPVVRALREFMPAAELHIMALTTAYRTALSSGENPIGYKDFQKLFDEKIINNFGNEILSGNINPTVDVEESIAYLGINFYEWVECEGLESAREKWKKLGRRGFRPTGFFRKVLSKIQPDVVVATNSPRSEQAAIEAAIDCGIPCLTMVDLFALKDDPFTKRRIHADRITVLANSTKNNLIAAGVPAERISVTGNPAFDALNNIKSREDALQWKKEMGWLNKHIVLWAGHKEPSQSLECTDTFLGQEIQSKLFDWVRSRDDVCLVVRYHPNEWQDFIPPPSHERVHWSVPGDEPLLHSLLSADQVVVQATTVGVQAYAAGKRVIGLEFSPLVQRSGMNAGQLGFGRNVRDVESLIDELEQGVVASAVKSCSGGGFTNASNLIAQEILELYRCKKS